MKLEFDLMAGAETKAFLVDFTKQIDRLEKLHGLDKNAPKKSAKAEESEEEEESEDEDFGPKKTKKAASSSFDDEEEDEKEKEKSESEEEEDEDEKEEKEPKKQAKATAKTKAKKYTLDDVNDACKAKVAELIDSGRNRKVKGKLTPVTGKEARSFVLGILEENFETTSVTELEPEQYAEAIKALK